MGAGKPALYCLQYREFYLRGAKTPRFYWESMKYRTLNHFLAFGMAPQRGEIVDLTCEQAAMLLAERLVAPYETKVQAAPENKSLKKKSSESLPVAPVLPVRTAKRLKRTATN